jgi:hypothetical protein
MSAVREEPIRFLHQILLDFIERLHRLQDEGGSEMIY